MFFLQAFRRGDFLTTKQQRTRYRVSSLTIQGMESPLIYNNILSTWIGHDVLLYLHFSLVLEFSGQFASPNIDAYEQKCYTSYLRSHIELV